MAEEVKVEVNVEEDKEAIEAQTSEEPQEGFSKAMEEEGEPSDADNPKE